MSWGFRNAVSNFSAGADVVAKELLELIAESLGLHTDFFAKHFTAKRVQALRWNFYPACPRPTDSIGAAAHTDGTCLTLLVQDGTGGLQIKKDDQWIGIRPIEGALVVNIGDMLHVRSLPLKTPLIEDSVCLDALNPLLQSENWSR